MLVTITVLFIASWRSLAVLHLSNGYVHGTVSAKVMQLLVGFNSSVNSFLYALFSDQYKEGFKDICLRCCPYWRSARDTPAVEINRDTGIDNVRDTKM